VPASTSIRDLSRALLQDLRTWLLAACPDIEVRRITIRTATEYLAVDGNPESADLPAVVLFGPRQSETACGIHVPGVEVVSQANADGTYMHRPLPQLVDVNYQVRVQSRLGKEAVLQALTEGANGFAAPGRVVGGRPLETLAMVGSAPALSDEVLETVGEWVFRRVRLYPDTTETEGKLATEAVVEMRDPNTEAVLDTVSTED
jgi:hypothetical protein